MEMEVQVPVFHLNNSPTTKVEFPMKDDSIVVRETNSFLQCLVYMFLYIESAIDIVVFIL